MAAERLEIAEETQPAWWPMIGVHLGLLVVLFGAIYTSQIEIRGMVPTLEWGRYGLVGLALVLVGVIPAWDVRSAAGRGLLALGAALALYLAYEPQLLGLPGGERLFETPLVNLEPTLAHVGIVIAALFLGLQMAIGGRALPRKAPFRASLLVAAALLLGLMAIMWLAFRGLYNLTTITSPAVLVFRTLSYGLLMLICLMIPGMRGVGRWAHIYIGLALIGVVVRNLMVN